MKIETAHKISTKTASQKLAEIYAKYRHVHGSAIPILQEIQGLYGYLPEEAINWIADRLEVPRSRFFGVATFYSQFYFKPRGKNVITVCCGTACHVKGSDKLLNRARREFDLPEDGDTTEDLNFTVERVACLGTCSMAPAVIINRKMHGKMTSDKLIKGLRALKKKK